MKYVITALSRLSGRREVISSPKDFTTCQEMRDRWSRRLSKQKSPVYRLLRVEEAVEEGRLW